MRLMSKETLFTVAMLATLQLLSSIVDAAPLTVNDWDLEIWADAGDPNETSSHVIVEDNMVTLPFNVSRSATDTPSRGDTMYDFRAGTDVATFNIEFEHVRGGIDNGGTGGFGDSRVLNFGTIRFTANNDTPYSIAGQYAL